MKPALNRFSLSPIRLQKSSLLEHSLNYISVYLVACLTELLCPQEHKLLTQIIRVLQFLAEIQLTIGLYWCEGNR